MSDIRSSCDQETLIEAKKQRGIHEKEMALNKMMVEHLKVQLADQQVEMNALKLKLNEATQAQQLFQAQEAPGEHDLPLKQTTTSSQLVASQAIASLQSQTNDLLAQLEQEQTRNKELEDQLDESRTIVANQQEDLFHNKQLLEKLAKEFEKMQNKYKAVKIEYRKKLQEKEEVILAQDAEIEELAKELEQARKEQSEMINKLKVEYESAKLKLE